MEQIRQLEQRNALLHQALEKAPATPQGQQQYAQLSPVNRHQLDAVKDSQDSLQQRLGALQGALTATPEKAVAVSILRQQFQDSQERTRGDLDALRGELGRLFTLTHWFIGLMFTIALGVLGMGTHQSSQER